MGSASLTTAGSAVEASGADYVYGSERAASGDFQTNRTFTGHKSDASGLLYYHARDDDPALGTFISPDTLVANPARAIGYNRFLYARGNPLKVTDSSSNQPAQPALWDDPSLCGGPYDIPGGGVRSWPDKPFWLSFSAKVIP